MKPTHLPPLPPPRAVDCDVAAWAWVRVPVDAVGELRRQPGPVFDVPPPVGALKQADEQTVAAVAAVARAMHASGRGAPAFRDWAVLAAPHFMGRPAMAAALQRYRGEGAWGASPHLPPHRSLHSPSGAISQLFKVHGPNYGVCGGPGCATEILAGAAAMIDARRVPGVWAVLTAFDPDLPPDAAGALAPGTHVVALALALTPPAASVAGGIRLRVVAAASPASPPSEASAPILDLFTLHSILESLNGASAGTSPTARRASFILPLEAGGRVEIERVGWAADPAHPNGDGAALDARLLSPASLAEAKR